MPDGSMRSVIIAWIRMSLGISILLFPKYAQHIGVIPAALMILLGAFVNYKTY
jgi:amino acid permease